MSKLIHPKNYKPLLDMRQTEQGIKLIKEFFQQNLHGVASSSCHGSALCVAGTWYQ